MSALRHPVAWHTARTALSRQKHASHSTLQNSYDRQQYPETTLTGSRNGEHDMECADAGTYASIVCHYCIDVPKLVCESICASGLDQTPSNCNWSPWWAWHGLSGGEGWCCGGY